MKYAISKELPQTLLCELFYKYGSDKCPQIYHSYSPKYYKILEKYQNIFTDVIEIGIGTNELMKPIVGNKYQIGASLKAWRDFFKKSTIYGLEINKDVLFEEERIKCFYTDQFNETQLHSSINEIRHWKGKTELLFDLILDDGSHILEHQILTIKTLFKYLKPNGFYIIEDIQRSKLNIFKKLKLDGKIIEIHEGVPRYGGDTFIVIKKFK